MKKILLFYVLFFTLVFYTQAQYKVNTVGVINEHAIYNSVVGLSDAAKKYNEEKLAYKKQLSDYVAQAKSIQAMLDFEKDFSKKQTYQEEISNLKIEIKNYRSRKEKELKQLELDMLNSDNFYKRLLDAVKKVSAVKGLIAILSTKDPNLIWYSGEVDITKNVITCMKQNKCR